MQCCLPTLAWEWEEERRRPGAISLEPDDGAESFDRSIEGLTETPFPGQNANQRLPIRILISFLPSFRSRSRKRRENALIVRSFSVAIVDRLERKAREGTDSGREGEGRTGKNPVASNERILHFPRTEFIHSAEKLRLRLFLSSVVGCRSLALVRSFVVVRFSGLWEGGRSRSSSSSSSCE